MDAGPPAHGLQRGQAPHRDRRLGTPVYPRRARRAV